MTIDFAPEDLTPAFDTVFTRNIVADGPSQLLEPDQSRVWVCFIDATGITGHRIAPYPLADEFQGMTLGDGARNWEAFLFRDIGTLIGGAWFLFAGAIGEMEIIEVKFKPRFIRDSSPEE